MYLGMYMYIHICMIQQLMTEEPVSLRSRRRIWKGLEGNENGDIIILKTKRNFKKVPGLFSLDINNTLTLLLCWLKKMFINIVKYNLKGIDCDQLALRYPVRKMGEDSQKHLHVFVGYKYICLYKQMSR